MGDCQRSAAAERKTNASAGSGFIEGAIVYTLGRKGLMASADVSGTRFWVDDKLN